MQHYILLTTYLVWIRRYLEAVSHNCITDLPWKHQQNRRWCLFSRLLYKHYIKWKLGNLFKYNDIPYSRYYKTVLFLFLRLFSSFLQRKIVSKTSQKGPLIRLLFNKVFYSIAPYNSENMVTIFFLEMSHQPIVVSFCIYISTLMPIHKKALLTWF